MSQDCCIIIPAFNEEENISKTILSLKKYDFYIIVINDGSTDLTQKLLSKLNVDIVNHKSNLGYDKAIESGFKRALDLKYNFVITFDADGQHDPFYLPLFYDKLISGFHLVIGQRPKFQRFSEYIFSIYSSLFYGIFDPMCGLKAYNIKLFIENGCFDNFNSIGTNLMFFGAKQKYPYCNLKIQLTPRNGKSRFGSSIKSNLIIVLSLFKNIYFNHIKK